MVPTAIINFSNPKIADVVEVKCLSMGISQSSNETKHREGCNNYKELLHQINCGIRFNTLPAY